ncbi:MAG: hypothetical protein HY318_05770 [Armatimonadetes bacterium]|nr:hypothetical protein [Armatimonadota bacterium]
MVKVEEYLSTVFGLDLSTEPDRGRLLRNAGLLAEVAGDTLATVTGVLFFGKHPDALLYSAGVLAARIKGADLGGDIEDRRDIVTTIPEVIEDTLSFFRAHNQTSARFEGAKRIDRPLYPEEVVREAVVNAVAHRNYSITGSKVRFLVFDDRIEVRSPGGLPNTATMDEIRAERTFIRNQLLVQILNNLRYIERLGRGVPTMLRRGKEFSGREPDLEEKAEEFVVTIYRRETSRE